MCTWSHVHRSIRGWGRSANDRGAPHVLRRMWAGVMGTQDLVVLAAEVAGDLGMQLPPVNGAAVLHRLVSDLRLPKASALTAGTLL